jgi:hypothetical protein
MVYFRNRLPKGSVGGLLLAILLPLACIWYSDKIGSALGSGRNPELNPDWSIFVRFVGWVLLLLPTLIFIYKKINQ